MNVTLDIGGTNTRIGFSKDSETFSDIIKFATPKNYVELAKSLYSHLVEASKGEPYENIMVGIAGFIDHKNSEIITCPHIPYLKNTPIRKLISVDCKNLFIENDAALAGLAEAIKGEGKKYSRVCYITISTGVGGTLIVDKKLPSARFSFEPGHHIINFHGRELALKNIKGSWESFSSGTGFKSRYGIEPSESSDANLWNEYGEILAAGLHNVTLFWQPDVIVLGGSMSKKAPLFLKSLENAMTKSLQEYKPDIKISSLGDENGLMGGLLKLKLQGQPH